MATLQKRRPSRMVLSPKVAETSPPLRDGGKPSRKPKPGSGAFGGMNKTSVDVSKLRTKGPARRDFKGSQITSAKAKPTTQPFKALKMQRALSPVSYDKRSQVKQALSSRDSFTDFALLPIIQQSIEPQALQGRADAVPSPIQRLAIPALLKKSSNEKDKRQFLLAAETGSGKTLAYLLPVIDALKRAELREKSARSKPNEDQAKPERDALWVLEPPDKDQPDPDTGRPKAIVLVPTSELVDQVGSVIKSLSHTVKYRAALLSASYSGPIIRNRLFSPKGVDIVVSTPHLLSSIVEADPNVVARVTHMVIDEADSLLDRSFAPLTRAILDRATPSMKQLILCSATIPRNLDSFLRKHYPDIERLTTPNLHAIPRRVQLSVVDIEGEPYKGNRKLACADTIWNMGKETVDPSEASPDRVLRLIVFVNERETTEEVAGFLKTKGIDATALNRDASDRQTSDVLAEFTGMPIPVRNREEKPKDTPNAKARLVRGQVPERHLPNVKVLVMTDIGSRGIDTLEVRNVILYDVPHTSIDFIHRLGRVGRMNRRGRGYVLVGKGDRKDIVKEVRTGMFMGKALI
ncbi:ATP-dependent RNA helicase mrh4, mitochondrial [Sphaceloma murrayae]|uniref:RNA helicase n=1 Tax=Sphaceloma murrayae TaxID=2082308 RepID=A0A2K1QJB6_9PEZI|nr:ATP-dependent RNA helicase mrh4, mitochondrial [Sphaceloma murrayae]